MIFYEEKSSNLTEHNNYPVKEYTFPFSQRNIYCMVLVSHAVITMARCISLFIALWQSFVGNVYSVIPFL